MAFLLVKTTERIPWEIPDQTGDDRPGIVWICRMQFKDLQALRVRFGKGEEDPSKWEAGAYEAFQDEIIRRGFIETEAMGVLTRDGFQEVKATVEDILAQPEDFRTALTKRICFSFATSKPLTPRAAMLGNSPAT